MDQNPPLHVAETRATRSSSAQKGRNKAPEQLPKKPMQKRKKKTFGSKREVPEYRLH